MASEPSEQYRRDYARRIAQMAGVRDRRIERAFAAIPREDFLPPPPWTAISPGVFSQTSELARIYENVLVAIDRKRGINNGEPALHAAWLDTVGPQPGDTVIHVGAGTGYYTAILGALVQPGGRVEAYEYEPDLAAEAEANLESYPGVTVHGGSAYGRALPRADVIYVNAGVVAPDVEWLLALRQGGRLIFPWQPCEGWGPTLLVTRSVRGFQVAPLMNVGFISCSGVPEMASQERLPAREQLEAIRSVWIRSETPPDRSAVVIYDDVWFSSARIGPEA
jgi:protein-L-isoaspartate(D-aspartate) O-methyltransferase